MKRKQTKEMEALTEEYTQLKEELFKGESFAVHRDEDKEKWERHDQLRALFFPHFRTKKWRNPLVKSK
jgi:hypothetical protein